MGTERAGWTCMGVRSSALLLGALVIGAVVTFDPGGWSPFGPAKWLAVSTLSLAGGGLALWTGRATVDRSTARCWTALLVMLGLGAVANGDVRTALLGHPERHLGLATWLLFALLFAAGQQLRGVRERRVIERALAISAVALGAYAMWELLVGRPVAIAAITSRLTGSFGSAAYLGAAACLLVPAAGGLAFDRNERREWRLVAAAGVGLGLVALIGSGARAAWLGGLSVLIVAMVKLRPSRRLVLGVFALVAIGFAVIAPRLGAITTRSVGAASRLDEWAVAARVIGDHPLIGVGPEGYRIAVAEGIDRNYERTYGRDRVLPDRAHSAPIDVALAGGLPAGIAYVVLLALLGKRMWSSIRRDGPATTVGVAAGVLAYGVQQLLLFPLAEIDPVAWLCCGMVIASTANPASPERASRWTFTARRAAGGLILLLVPVAFIAGVLDVAADRLARRSILALAAGESANAVDDAARAVRLRPDNIRYRVIAADAHAASATLADIDDAITDINAALSWSPHDLIAGEALGSLMLQRARITGDQRDTFAALQHWENLVARDPHRAFWQVQLGRVAVLTGDRDLARTAWTTAADLSPNDPTAGELLAALDQSTP